MHPGQAVPVPVASAPPWAHPRAPLAPRTGGAHHGVALGSRDVAAAAARCHPAVACARNAGPASARHPCGVAGALLPAVLPGPARRARPAVPPGPEPDRRCARAAAVPRQRVAHPVAAAGVLSAAGALPLARLARIPRAARTRGARAVSNRPALPRPRAHATPRALGAWQRAGGPGPAVDAGLARGPAPTAAAVAQRSLGHTDAVAMAHHPREHRAGAAAGGPRPGRVACAAPRALQSRAAEAVTGAHSGRRPSGARQVAARPEIARQTRGAVRPGPPAGAGPCVARAAPLPEHAVAADAVAPARVPGASGALACAARGPVPGCAAAAVTANPVPGAVSSVARAQPEAGGAIGAPAVAGARAALTARTRPGAARAIAPREAVPTQRPIPIATHFVGVASAGGGPHTLPVATAVALERVTRAEQVAVEAEVRPHTLAAVGAGPVPQN